MKKIEGLGKSHAEEDCPSLNRLPDEILLQIFRKLIDLKTLCFCYLVSTRFSSIVLQVDAVSFIAPLLISPDPDPNHNHNHAGFSKNLFRFILFKPIHLFRRMIVANTTRPLPPIISSFYGDSFRSAISFLGKFKRVKSLRVQLPSSSHKGIHDDCLFKWMVKFGNRIESFSFLSPNSINADGNSGEQVDMELRNDLFKQKVHIAFQCLKDVIVRHRMLMYFVKDLPLLEEIAITDSGRRGRLYLGGVKLANVRNWIETASETVKPQLKTIEVPVSVSQCYVPMVEMPVSGYFMKGATLVLMDMNDLQSGDHEDVMICEDGFEDKEAAAYGEAVMEIMVRHKSRMKKLL